MALVEQAWHTHGMNRVRLSTTVDAELLGDARRYVQARNDAALLDEALRLLVEQYRRAEIDASYAAYDEHPLDEPDEWGSLAAWRDAAGRA
jgi:hypothetical protein